MIEKRTMDVLRQLGDKPCTVEVRGYLEPGEMYVVSERWQRIEDSESLILYVHPDDETLALDTLAQIKEWT